jgi:hypothetical protein
MRHQHKFYHDSTEELGQDQVDTGYYSQEEYASRGGGSSAREKSKRLDKNIQQLKRRLNQIDQPSLQSPPDLSILSAFPPETSVNEERVGLLTKAKNRFRQLQMTEVEAELGLKEFLIKARNNPGLYVNFLDKFDERSRQLLNLALYETLESASRRSNLQDSGGKEPVGSIDYSLIEQLKEEMVSVQFDLAKCIEELDIERTLRSQQVDLNSDLRMIILQLIENKVYFSEWIELVISTFTEVFKCIPNTPALLEQGNRSLSNHIKTVIKMCDFFQGLTLENTQSWEDYLQFLPLIEEKNKKVKSMMDSIYKDQSYVKSIKTSLQAFHNLTSGNLAQSSQEESRLRMELQ